MIKVKHTAWNLKPLFRHDNDPKMIRERKKILRATNRFRNKWYKRTDYLHNPKILKLTLDEYENLNRYYGADGAQGYYFSLKHSLNKNNPRLKARLNKTEEFGKKNLNKIRFFELNLAKIKKTTQTLFLKSSHLKDYKYFLYCIFKQAAYILTEQEEKIITLKSGPAHNTWVRTMSGFLAKEERKIFSDNGRQVKKTFAEILELSSNQKKKIRDSAATALNDIFWQNSDIAEAEINAILHNKKIDDELRGQQRSDLSRHLSDGMDSNNIDKLIRTVADHFYIAKKFYRLKARLLGVRKLAYHERNVIYGNINKKYSFKNGVNLIERVFNRLDADFSKILVNFVSHGQIDVYPKKGKTSGAFCTYDLITLPVYIKLNYTNTIKDVLTFAHELGHGINDELTRIQQNSLNFGTSMATAEVASTFMEDFVLEQLLLNADDETRLALMMQKLNDDISSIFRQIAFYKFEQELHQAFKNQGYLSKTFIGQLFKKHMKSYMGTAVNQTSGSENWWIYIGHFRMFFYVYSYASGLLISKALQSKVRKNPNFINEIKVFFSAGLSDSPQNIFKKLGLDISKKTFWQKGLAEIDNLLKDTWRLAKKLKKI